MPGGGYSGTTIGTQAAPQAPPVQGTFNVTNTSTQLLPANTKRKLLRIWDDDKVNDVFVGAGVPADTTTGDKVQALNSAEFTNTAAINVIAGVAGPTVIRFYEELYQ